MKALTIQKKVTMKSVDKILTVAQIAAELRCSRAHVYKAINGEVTGVSRLPAIRMGRRKLVRRSSLELWKEGNEKGSPEGGMIESLPELDAVNARKEGT